MFSKIFGIFNLGKFMGKKFNLSEQGSRDLNKAVWACVLTNVAAVLPYFVFLQIIAVVLEPLISGAPADWPGLWMWLGIGVAAAALFFLASKLDYTRTYVASYSESEKNRVAVAERIRKLPMSFFFRKDLSELTTNIMSDCTNIEGVLSHILPQLAANAISTAVICVVLALFNWMLALSVFCMLPVSLAIIFLSKKYQTGHFKTARTVQLEVTAQTQEYIDGVKVIKAFGTKGKKFENMEKSLRNMRKMQIKMEFGVGVLVTGASILLQAGLGITVFVGSSLLVNGAVAFPVFLTFILISSRIYAPVLTILMLLPELFLFATTTKRMRMLATEPIMSGGTPELSRFDVEFKNVTFAYNDKNVVKNLSCVMRQGDVTAVVGASGSGKSTLARLAARFFDVNSGAVTIGGVDVKTIDPEHLMRYMSFVFQDVVLFNDTVKGNIRIGNPDASDGQVLKAARDAMCDEFIAKLPGGYDAVIGENGCTLSGGERQRVSIARALLKNAPIVLLDEATASLDPENEASVQRAISRLIKNKTVIVIAHRLRTVAGADNILVLDNGVLAEQGSHAALMSKKGVYERLYTVQSESLGWSI
ncbi:MAG: ABC transporter ATP-binding protein/permease [Clostridiales bacterium]|jgi:ATP-binding cassette subfamily B protein|nr:ABC transporter ATP-binding protein/permease [Clostridiales bacterium]